MENIISIQNLNFAYSSKKILDNLSIHVPRNSIYGFLGPNGSGKTTTIRLMLGLIPHRSDNINLFNKSLKRYRTAILQNIGSLVEAPSLYPHLSGYENLELTRKLIGNITKTKIDEVLEIVKLNHDAHVPTKKYSLGMKQRLGLAIALLNNPDVLILDEPTNGLDPTGIKEMREFIVDLHRHHNKTIFLSSHLLGEIEKMATHVGILKTGKCVFEGALNELEALLHKNIIRFKVDNAAVAEQIINNRMPSIKTSIEASWLTLHVDDDLIISSANKLLINQGISVSRIEHKASNLESLFIELTEQAL
ncbi:MAG: ATP-binding cassette domain-containing protein [Cyclobacteriaceae bacterium]|nr:ATP-binding cassette domain-containing protein [Cyclobacteriaceae bacterium]